MRRVDTNTCRLHLAIRCRCAIAALAVAAAATTAQGSVVAFSNLGAAADSGYSFGPDPLWPSDCNITLTSCFPNKAVGGLFEAGASGSLASVTLPIYAAPSSYPGAGSSFQLNVYSNDSSEGYAAGWGQPGSLIDTISGMAPASGSAAAPGSAFTNTTLLLSGQRPGLQAGQLYWFVVSPASGSGVTWQGSSQAGNGYFSGSQVPTDFVSNADLGGITQGMPLGISFSVDPVPLPADAWLLLSGLFALGLAWRIRTTA